MLAKLLAKTYLDAIATIRPAVAVAADRDCAAIRAAGLPWPVQPRLAFPCTVDDACRGVVKAMMQYYADEVGVPLSAIYNGETPIYDVMPRDMATQIEANAKLLVQLAEIEYWALLEFKLAGEKVYRFSDALISQLAVTSSNVDCEFLKLPFRTVAFVSQAPLLINAMHAVQRDNPGPPTDAPQDGVNYTIPVTIVLTLGSHPDLDVPVLEIRTWQGNAHHQLLNQRRGLALLPGRSVEQALRTDWDAIRDEIAPHVELGQTVAMRDREVDWDFDMEAFHGDGLFFYRLVVNMCLYITSSDPDLVPGIGPRLPKEQYDRLNRKERDSLKRSQSAASEYEFTDVGLNMAPIPIPRLDHQDSGQTRRSGTLSVRFRVSAHWRHIRAEDGSLLKRIWVRDHMKGPEMAQLVNRSFEVTLPSEQKASTTR